MTELDTAFSGSEDDCDIQYVFFISGSLRAAIFPSLGGYHLIVGRSQVWLQRIQVEKPMKKDLLPLLLLTLVRN